MGRAALVLAPLPRALRLGDSDPGTATREPWRLARVPWPVAGAVDHPARPLPPHRSEQVTDRLTHCQAVHGHERGLVVHDRLCPCDQLPDAFRGGPLRIADDFVQYQLFSWLGSSVDCYLTWFT